MRYGSITALTSTSVTIPSLYLNTNRAGTQAQDETILLRPDAATAADRKRYITSIVTSTGAATVTGTYADTTATSETGEEWILNVDPDVDILDALNYSLRYTMVRTFYMLSNVGPDLNYDMQEAATTDYDSIRVGTPTLSVVTTARRTLMGRRSLRALNGTANHGIKTPTIANVMGHNAQAFLFGSVDVGTVTAGLYDVTNSAVIGDTVALEEEAEMLVRVPWQATPATCKEICIQALGDTSSTDAYYNGAGIVQQGNRRMYFPSAISERFKAPAIFMAVPQETSSIANVYPAHSIEYVRLTEGDDFTFMFHHPDANPYGIVLTDDSFLEWPVFAEAQIPASDLGTFSTEASTTVADAHVFIPRATLRVIDHVLIPRFGAQERWVATRGIAEKELNDALKVRATPVVAPPRKWWGGPHGRRI